MEVGAGAASVAAGLIILGVIMGVVCTIAILFYLDVRAERKKGRDGQKDPLNIPGKNPWQ